MNDELMYHHSRNLDHVRYALEVPWRVTQALPEPACTNAHECSVWDDWHDGAHMEAAYEWLARRVGFWPCWLAVGSTDEDRRMTGYASQFRRDCDERWRNQVLFSWRDMPPGAVHLAYSEWYLVLNSIDVTVHEHARPRHRHCVRDEWVPSYWERRILRRSWTPARWRRQARTNPYSVQAVAPMLDVRCADEVWCRNQAARRQLLNLGFAADRVHVRRLTVDGDSV